MDTATGLVIATSIMALGAITFSALSLAFQRSHSRKSVRPFCNVIQRKTDNRLSVCIQNAGMGPMRIQRISLLANEGDPIQTGIPLEEAFALELSAKVSVQHLDAFVLAPLQDTELFRCEFGAHRDEAKSELRGKLGGYFLCIVYSDLYDDVYEKKEALIF